MIKSKNEDKREIIITLIVGLLTIVMLMSRARFQITYAILFGVYVLLLAFIIAMLITQEHSKTHNVSRLRAIMFITTVIFTRITKATLSISITAIFTVRF